MDNYFCLVTIFVLNFGSNLFKLSIITILLLHDCSSPVQTTLVFFSILKKLVYDRISQ